VTSGDGVGSAGGEAGPERYGTELSGATLDLVVTGYLSAVARALDRRGVAESRLRIGPSHAEQLAGSLDLEPIRFPHHISRVTLRWDERSGCSALLYHHDATDGSEPLVSRRYLHSDVVPAPDVVAAFVADLCAGRDVGMPYPADVLDRGHIGEHRRIRVLAALAQHALPEVRLWMDHE
jgi:hypothetical protein